MSITFNAFEIFEIAEQIERNGAKFYRKAAEIVKDEQAKQMLLALASTEIVHEQTFGAMKKHLNRDQQTVFDPDNEMTSYLQSLANCHVFDLKKDISQLLSGNESLNEILEIAIAAEKDSIIYYLGIKDLVPNSGDKQKIDNIIKEEMSHITVLNQQF